MYLIFLFILTIIAVGIIFLSFHRSSNPLLALGGILLIVTGMFISSSGVEVDRISRITLTDVDANTIGVDFNYSTYTPLVALYPELWVINQLYLYLGILCLLFVFANFLYKNWIKTLMGRGI